MSINELTIGEAKDLVNLFSNSKSTSNLGAHMIGKVCMFRTYSAGVHFGILAEKDGQSCLVRNSQRVFSWVKACSLSQLAMEGSKDFSDCKISVAVDEIILEQVIEIIPMPDNVVADFRGAKIWRS